MDESEGKEEINVRFEEPLKKEFHDNMWVGLAFVNKDAVSFELEVTLPRSPDPPDYFRFSSFKLKVDATLPGKHVYEVFRRVFDKYSVKSERLRKPLGYGYMEAAWDVDNEKIDEVLKEIGEKIGVRWRNEIANYLKNYWEWLMKKAEERLRTEKELATKFKNQFPGFGGFFGTCSPLEMMSQLSEIIDIAKKILKQLSNTA